MKNILYITYVDFYEHAFPGVEAKIAGHIKTMSAAGYHVDRINQYGKAAQLVDTESGKAELFQAPISRRFSLLKAVKAALKHRRYAAAYIRFQFFSEDVRRMTHLLKMNGAKVLLEIPTFPYEGELHQQGPKGEIKLLCDRMFRGSCAKNIDSIVTLSDDAQIFGLPCINMRNGLDYSLFPIRNVNQPTPDTLHLLVVASIQPWQGYDRLINGLVDYYQKDRHVRVYAHLVGDGMELENYKQTVSGNGLNEFIHFYGQINRDSIHEIANLCDIAVGSLGSFRRPGVTKLSTLKSREYCAWGFPTINATYTDILDADDPFCLFIPEDESPVDIEAVVAFYQRVYFESGLSAEQIAHSIREKARSRSDVNIVFQPVLDHIRNGDKK